MEDFVTLEQARKLKDLGFDWKCTHYYEFDKLMTSREEISVDSGYDFIVSIDDLADNFNSDDWDYDIIISAPTLAQAQKWLREVKGIDVIAIPTIGEYGKKKYRWQITIYKEDFGEESKTIPTYEQALSEGVDKVLELLKEKQ